MKKILGIYEPVEEPVCLTLGVYDGIHRGHKAIIDRVKNISRKNGYKSCVLTFYPHPQKVIRRNFSGLIFPFYYRLELLKSCGFDYCTLIRFNKKISVLSAERFLGKIRSIFKDIRVVVAGQDFRMGSDRLHISQMKNSKGLQGIEFVEVKDIFSGGQRISSTLIKKAVKEGDFKKAENLLGSPYFIMGPVIKGMGIGKKIGFPTANLDTEDLVIPREGVYTAEVFFKGRKIPALISIGTRPTFHRSSKVVCEVCFPSFSGNLRGGILRVRPDQYIRPQKKFPSADSLRKQIKKDLRHISS